MDRFFDQGRWVLTRLDGRLLYKTDEALAVAIDSSVNPIANGNRGTGVWEAGVNITFLDRRCVALEGKDGSTQKRGCGSSLHLAGKTRE